MSKATDTFHLAFDTETYPGRIECVEITIRRNITGDPSKKYRIDLVDHPLYQKLRRYCLDNPGREPSA